MHVPHGEARRVLIRHVSIEYRSTGPHTTHGPPRQCEVPVTNPRCL